MSAGSHHCDGGREAHEACAQNCPRKDEWGQHLGASCGLLLGLGESLVPSDQLQGRPVSYPKLTSSSGDTDRPLAPRT